MQKEQEYRIVDSLYRLHEDLFHVEDLLASSLIVERIRTNTFFGALIVGIITVVPILISLLDIKRSSTGAYTIYAIAVLLIVLVVCIAIKTQKEFKAINMIVSDRKVIPLERNPEFILEMIASWGIRYLLLIDGIKEMETELAKMKRAEAGEETTKEIVEIEKKIKRFLQSKDFCISKVRSYKEMSKRLLQGKKISEDQFEVIEKWSESVLE